MKNNKHQHESSGAQRNGGKMKNNGGGIGAGMAAKSEMALAWRRK
jgi:hypothetical protein